LPRRAPRLPALALTAFAAATISAAACAPSDAVRDTPLPEACAELGVAEARAPEPAPNTAVAETAAATSAEGPGERIASAPPLLFVNATVLTATGERFEGGHVYVVDGRIASVGAGPITPDRADVRVIDAGGRFLTPGLIDTHSHLGVYPSPSDDAHSDGNEATNPLTPEVEAIHSVWPQDPGFFRALAGGVTTLQILPGSANLVGGRTVTLKLHRGARVADELRFPGAPDGLKMACGENPKRVYGERGGPSTRMGSVARMRAAWNAASTYRETRTEYRDDLRTWCEEGAAEDTEPAEPALDLASETLAAVLDGDILVHVHCYRADEMLVQIQLAQEFGYQIRSFHHAVEAYKIRDVLAELDIATSTWADWWGFKLEAFDAIEENAGLLAEAGARAIIHSDSDVGIQRLNQDAAKAYFRAIEAGVAVTEDEALRWITLNPAWALGVDDQTGSIEVGKMADLVLWSAHPFSVYAEADYVVVDGVVEHDRAAGAEPWSDFEVGQWNWEAQP
jgi:imidazolonepropionase-like amidohydrolase